MGHSEQAKKQKKKSKKNCAKKTKKREKYSDIHKEEMQSWWIAAWKTQEMVEKKTSNRSRLNRFTLGAQGLWWLSLHTAV